MRRTRSKLELGGRTLTSCRGTVYCLGRRPDTKFVDRLTGFDEPPMFVRSSLKTEDEAGRQPMRCGLNEIVAVARPGVVVKVEVEFERVAVYVPRSGRSAPMQSDLERVDRRRHDGR